MVPRPEHARTLADVLMESLTAAIGDAVVAERLLGESLRHASRAAVPREKEELLSFVWAHLVPLIVRPLGAAVVSSFVDGLRANLEEAEDDPLRRSGVRDTPPSLPRLVVPESAPAAPPSSAQTQSMKNPSSERGVVASSPISSTPSGKMHVPARPLSEPGVPASASRVPLSMPQSSVPPVSSGVRITRRTVLLVDSDKIRRATLARQLIRNGIEVVACDAREAMHEQASAGPRIDAVLVAEVGRDASDFLESLGTTDPAIPVIGWTRNLAATDVMLRSYGLSAVTVVSTNDAPALERILVAIRKRRP